MAGPRIVLIGPPGAGKTTVASLLAEHWSIPVRDTDRDIESREGRAIAEIFLDKGETYFRECEREAVALALNEHDGVVSLGGGAVLASATQEALRHYSAEGGSIVFLDVSVTAAAPRVGLNAARPLLVGNPRARWRELMDERRPLYESLATETIMTDDLTPQQVADAIIERER